MTFGAVRGFPPAAALTSTLPPFHNPHPDPPYNPPMPAASNDTARTAPTWLADRRSAVNAWLEQFLASRDLPARLREGVAYAVLGGGKRLRPILAVLSCEACDSSNAGDPLPSGGALELVHAFSLVHDDLPAMDNDDFRRGRPTAHKQFGEAMGILIGDALLSLATEALLTWNGPDDTRARLMHELASATTRMIAGQVEDTLGPSANHEIDPAQRLLDIHRQKTGALIRAACRMGGLAGGANENQLDGLTRYGEAIGLMFQIVDDLLDITATRENLGKTPGKDDAAGKLTFPSVHGIDASKQEVRRLLAEANEALTAFKPDSSEPLRALASYLAVRSA